MANRYSISDIGGRVIMVVAEDWSSALCQALDLWQLDVSSWECKSQEDGTIHVWERSTGAAWLVQRISAAPSSEDSQLSTTGWVRGTAEEMGCALPTPAPVPARITPSPRPSDLAERLFELSLSLSEAQSLNGACGRALELMISLVPAEAASVLKGGLNDNALTFVAAAGPAANKLLNRRLKYGCGLVGASFDRGITIHSTNVAQDENHYDGVDQLTGFVTRDALCVPIRGPSHFFGVTQLLNSPNGFLPWHVDVVEQVCGSLATRLTAL